LRISRIAELVSWRARSENWQVGWNLWSTTVASLMDTRKAGRPLAERSAPAHV